MNTMTDRMADDGCTNEPMIVTERDVRDLLGLLEDMARGHGAEYGLTIRGEEAVMWAVEYNDALPTYQRLRTMFPPEDA